MNTKNFLIAIFSCLLIQPLWAQEANEPPQAGFGGVLNIREQGLAPLSAVASDPENDPLTYSWEITSDPTGQAFFRLPGGAPGGTTVQGSRFPTLALPGGAGYPNPTYVGQEIEVTLTVSDGVNTTTASRSIPVIGVNREPVIVVDRSQLGTASNPRKPPEGIGLNAAGSYDPDAPSEEVKMIWRVASVVGQTCLNNADIVLLGKETENPGIVVPPNQGTLTNPVEITFELVLEDGLIFKQLQYKGYMYDPNGCGGGGGATNPRPVVSLGATSTHAAFGQTVTLTGTVTDPGDTHTYSWVQLGTTGGSAVTLSNPSGRITTFTAPSTPGFLTFQFTATDSVGQSDTKTITVQVSQAGGGSGGGGGGGGTGLGNGGQSGTPSGTSTGQLTCSGLGAASNQPARATVPATYTIVGGNRAQITASNGTDPDNTQVFVNGITVTGAVTYNWSVVDGGGFLTNSDLSGRPTNVVSFGTPFTSTQRSARLAVLVADGLGCGNTYNVDLVVQPSPTSPNNNAPTPRLQYSVQGTSQQGDAGAAISLTAPATVTLDAGGSTDPDGDTLSFSWSLQNSSGLTGVSLSTSGTSTRTLTALAGAVGTSTVTVTVSDGNGGSVTRSQTFQFQQPTDKPVQAVAVAMFEGAELDRAVGPGQVVVLSGAQSDIEEGTPEERAALTYQWDYVSGPVAFGRNLRQRDAEILVHDLTQVSTVTYRLTVRNGSATDTDLVSITVDPALRPATGEEVTGDLYFARVGFGPAGSLEFQTVLVIDNLAGEPVEDALVEFFGADGSPLEVRYLNTDGATPTLLPWDSAQALTIDGNSSRVLEFRALEGEPLTVGWARVTSSGSLRGSVRFQLLDDAGNFLSDVGIQSSALGSEFQAAFRLKDNLAFAVSNPGSETVGITVSVADRLDSGFRVEKTLTLGAGEHQAMFLTDFFPFLAQGTILMEGTLELSVIQADATIIPTVLITREQLAVSSQSFARIR